MAKYIYKKYNVGKKYTRYDDTKFEGRSTYLQKTKEPTFYSDYAFSSSSGFYGVGVISVNNWIAASRDEVITYIVTSKEVTGIRYVGSSGDDWIVRYTPIEFAGTSDDRGAYIGDVIAENGTYPTNGKHIDGYWYVMSVLANNVPIITDTTENNKTFYEGDSITVNGSAIDVNNGNVVSIKYKINTVDTKAIATGISDGKTPINYSKTLTYTLGTLKDGDTVIADGLVDGQTYKITIWAEDDQGGKSTEVVRNFTVVPNRAPVLSVDHITPQTNKINSEKITISGTVTDADGNDVTVDVKINANSSVRVYSGIPSDFSYDIKIADLKEGENIITITSKDTFDFVTTKVIKLNKNRNAVPLKTAIARYKVSPPTGSSKEILVWIQKEVGDLTIDTDISMVLQGESEQYVAMNKLTAPINDFLEEDEFTYQALEEKDNITLKLKMTKESKLSTQSIKQISGVLG